jgi:methionyl aminopeptidase
MVEIKSDLEIELLRRSSDLVCRTLAEVARIIKPGISTKDLDKRAEEYIRDSGGTPGFLGYGGFPATLCTSINSAVVHGIPSEKEILKDGDIVSIDCGAILNGYNGDSAYTFEVGEVEQGVKKLLQVTQECLLLGLENAIEGKRLGDIGFAIQSHAEKNSYSVVRELVGHGIGKKLHESPEVPNYGRRSSGSVLKSGTTICIEPMINLGKRNIVFYDDGWTVKTADNLPSAHFELMVAVRKSKPDVLGTFKYIDEVIKSKA